MLWAGGETGRRAIENDGQNNITHFYFILNIVHVKFVVLEQKVSFDY